MLANRDQLTRWHRLLDQPPGADLPDAATLEAAWRAAPGRHRLWMTTALASIDLIRRGGSLALPPIAELPVRRPAIEGAIVADAVWLAYVHQSAGSTSADAWLRAFIETLAPTALVFTVNDNPEPWWQSEMLILHALHSFALRSGDAGLLDRTLACADYHLREIQPDHATNEPWAVHAYASHPDGNVTAESLLHAGMIQHGGVLGPVPRLICRDAAFALAAYLKS